MIKILKFIFHISTLMLIIISLWPGSLLGFFFYGNWQLQPNMIEKPYGTTINHFISYFYVSLIGFFAYLKNKNFRILVYGLLILSITLEVYHIIIPNRSFQVQDLLANIIGVMVAYFVIKIYLFLKRL